MSLRDRVVRACRAIARSLRLRRRVRPGTPLLHNVPRGPHRYAWGVRNVPPLEDLWCVRGRELARSPGPHTPTVIIRRDVSPPGLRARAHTI